MSDNYKLPRLYVDAPLSAQNTATLSADQAHYLKNVLRRQEGGQLRVFNGYDGEWLVNLKALGKKSAEITCVEQLRPQPPNAQAVHLLFAPIKKARQDFLIEKAVELGATTLHPVITERCEVRKLNMNRLNAQIVEAAQQCERLDIPELHELVSLPDKLTNWPSDLTLLAALERQDNVPDIKEINPSGDVAALIGPEGGLTRLEMIQLSEMEYVQPVSLGPNILRAETAACKLLSHISG